MLGRKTSLPGNSIRLKDLVKATDNWADGNLLGKGNFGKVYRGQLLDPAAPKASMWTGRGTHPDVRTVDVAVKKLDPESFQGYNEWLAEVLVLNKLQHPNLVRLLGYCSEKGENLLVYELCSHGSLEDVLFGPETPLTWEMRVDIACGIAEGLDFLHKNNVIHRDFKSANVLLGEGYVVRVTDFGLAKAGPSGDMTHVSTRVLGTLGYLDPTYMETGRLTKKSDTYAFGVLLMELVTGRPSMNEDATVSLTTWMRPYLSQRRPNLDLFVDPRMGNAYSKAGVVKLTILAKFCTHDDPARRPDMDALLSNLQKIERDVK